MLTLKL